MGASCTLPRDPEADAQGHCCRPGCPRDHASALLDARTDLEESPDNDNLVWGDDGPTFNKEECDLTKGGQTMQEECGEASGSERDKKSHSTDVPSSSPSSSPVKSGSASSVFTEETFDSCDKYSDVDMRISERKQNGCAVVNTCSNRRSGQPRLARFDERLASMPRGSNNHQWESYDASHFVLRSANYLKDKKKVPSGRALLDLVNVDFFRIPPSGPVYDVATHRDFYPAQHRANKDGRFLFIQNWIVPPFQALLISAVDPNAPWLKEDTPQARCWHRFLGESVEEQKKSFKAIISVEKGPWLVTRAVPKKPVLVGKQMKMSTHHEPGEYFQINFNVCGGSKTDQMAISMVMKSLSRLQLVLAMLIEGKKEEELPETLLVCSAMNQIDTSRILCADLS